MRETLAQIRDAAVALREAGLDEEAKELAKIGLRVAQITTNAKQGQWNKFLFDPKMMWSKLWADKGLLSQTAIECMNTALKVGGPSRGVPAPIYRTGPGRESETPEQYKQRVMQFFETVGTNNAWFTAFMNCLAQKTLGVRGQAQPAQPAQTARGPGQ